MITQECSRSWNLQDYKRQPYLDYENDLINGMKSLDLGIPLGETKNTLYYADDVVVMAESVNDIQK